MDEDWEKIEFRDVDFSFQNYPVLKGLNILISKGKSIAIIGRSGIGKSTLLDLLLRFYDPQSGAIFIDKKDIRSKQISQYRRLFAFVSQDPILFNGTVEENVDFGRDLGIGINEKALERANTIDFLKRRKHYLSEEVGDNGSHFSMDSAKESL